jgi:hypothetical protein
MRKVFGTNDNLFVDEYFDSDGELGVCMVTGSHTTADTWLTVDDTKELITHLQNLLAQRTE